jgi:p-hydroxybenzoate 3-monooxygenase
VIVERRDRAYIEGRVRAGVLERGTVNLMESLGLGERMNREGLVHGGTNLASDGEVFRIDMAALTGGATVMVYGQQEVMRDLFDAAEARGLDIVFDAEDVRPQEIEGERPFVTWRKHGETVRLDCDFIAGCDGYHGVSRQTIPADVRKTYERVYPFGWLGILVDKPPCDHELIYSNHEHGFALASMRSATRSRYYLQCSLDEKLEDWPDERFWDELCVRLGPKAASRVTRGESFEKSIAPLRSFVTEPMRHGRLFLAGDAAHIVPPTGAKGLNLAVADVLVLSRALHAKYRHNRQDGLDQYSETCLRRIWKGERFSWYMTTMLHRNEHETDFEHRIHMADLDLIRTSRASAVSLAENYVGLPFD